MKNRIISALLVVTFSLTLCLSAMASKPVEVVNVNEIVEEEKVDYIEKAEELQKEVDKKKAEEKAKKEEAERKAETARKEKEKAEKKAKESSKKSLGTYKLTAYCNCSKCCGKWAGGKTASGTTPRAGRTIAVDTRVIPFGTKVIINGNTYIAEDTGSAIKGNKIDIYFDSHKAALNFGVQHTEVFVYK